MRSEAVINMAVDTTELQDAMAKESTLVWMSSVLMEQTSMLPFLASSLDPSKSSTMEIPLMMESKSEDQDSV